MKSAHRNRDSLRNLGDKNLIARLERLRGEERAVQVAILRHLNELERRRLYLPMGYASLFEFCTSRLCYSRSSAGRSLTSPARMASTTRSGSGIGFWFMRDLSAGKRRWDRSGGSDAAVSASRAAP